MSRGILRIIDVEVTPNPYELAEAFWAMDEHEQATFFHHLGVISEDRLAAQLEAISQSVNLSYAGRPTMEMIGEYSTKHG